MSIERFFIIANRDKDKGQAFSYEIRDFLEGKGLSNEVNIRIFCYDPKDEMAVRYFIEKL